MNRMFGCCRAGDSRTSNQKAKAVNTKRITMKSWNKNSFLARNSASGTWV